MSPKELFDSIKAEDRIYTERGWYELAMVELEALSAALTSQENAVSQSEFEYFDDVAKVADYYATYYYSMYSLNGLQ